MRGLSSGPGHQAVGRRTGPMPTTWLTTSTPSGLPQERLRRWRRGPRGPRSRARWPARAPGGRRRSRTSACRRGRRGPGRGRVSGALRGLALEHLGVDRVGGHDRRPLRPLGVADLDGDRAALGAAVPHAAGEGDLVLLEGHPGAAAVAEPAAGEGGVEVGGLHLDAGGQPLQHGGELLTVRLTCGQPAQHARDSASAATGPRRQPGQRRGTGRPAARASDGAGQQRRAERDRRCASPRGRVASSRSETSAPASRPRNTPASSTPQPAQPSSRPSSPSSFTSPKPSPAGAIDRGQRRRRAKAAAAASDGGQQGRPRRRARRRRRAARRRRRRRRDR